MRHAKRQPVAREWAAYYAVRAVAALLASAAVLAVLTWIHEAHAAEGLVIELHDSSAVNKPRYTVGDVAAYIAGDERLWARVAAEPLAYAPAAGEHHYLAAGGLLGALKERGYDWQRITVQGAVVATIHCAQQSVPPETIRELLLARMADRLGVAVAIEESRPIPGVDLPDGDVSIAVRFPDKPGWWLPDALEFSVDGRLVTTLPLSQYMKFKLLLITAPRGIPVQTLINAGYLASEERVLAPGQEVATRVDQVLGMTTRSAVRSGARLKLSQLKAPCDVARGSDVMLIITVDGVVLRARAVALGDAYIGQHVVVKREDDGEKYTGRVCDGPVVVVE